MINPHKWSNDQITAIEKRLAIIASIKGRVLEDELVDIYMAVLMHLPYDCAEDCFQQSIINHKFFPSPAELIEPYKDVLDLTKSIVSDATRKAWIELYQAFLVIGPQKTVTFEDTRTGQVVAQFGGWPAICRMLSCQTERSLVENQFKAQYRAIKKAPTSITLLGTSGDESPVFIQRGFSIEQHYNKLYGLEKIEGPDNFPVGKIISSVAKVLSLPEPNKGQKEDQICLELQE